MEAYQISERINRDDARWFHKHPKARRRVRKYIPGEAWPLAVPPDVAWVIVERIGNNRVRYFTTTNPIEREQQGVAR